MADRDIEGGAKVASAILKEGKGAAESIALDVVDEGSIKNAVSHLQQRHGRLDVLVNNAGAHKGGSFQGINQAEWKGLFAINVDSVM